MKFLALAAILSLLVIPAAHAQGPSPDARVQTLRAQLEGFLENQQAAARKNGCRLETGGSIAVEKAPSGYYALTLPAFTYTDAKGVRSEIGMIAINAVPEDGGNWKISIALPTPIKSYDANGDDLFRTDIGTQSANGVWNENLGHFINLTSAYNNIQMNNLKDKSIVTIGTLNFSTAMTEQDAGAWTGTSNAVASNIGFVDGTTSFKGSLPAISMATNLADRAGTTPMTKEQIRNRIGNAKYDGLNIFTFLFGTPERLNAKITGLDSITGQLSQAMLTASPAARNELLKGVVAFTAISSMGRPVPGDASSKTYDIILGKDGNVTINGTNPQALVAPTPAQGMPAAPAPSVTTVPTTSTTTHH